MRTAAALAVTASAMFALAVAPAGIASAEQSAIVTIGNLEAAGYTVHVDRVGSAPLEECVVTGVRNPQEVRRWVRTDEGYDYNHGDDDQGFGGHHSDLVEIVVSKSISVSLDCSG